MVMFWAMLKHREAVTVSVNTGCILFFLMPVLCESKRVVIVILDF